MASMELHDLKFSPAMWNIMCINNEFLYFVFFNNLCFWSASEKNMATQKKKLLLICCALTLLIISS